MLGAALLLLPFMLTGFRISRVEGAVLTALYGAYVAAVFLGWGSLVAGAVAGLS